MSGVDRQKDGATLEQRSVRAVEGMGVSVFGRYFLALNVFFFFFTYEGRMIKGVKTPVFKKWSL